MPVPDNETATTYPCDVMTFNVAERAPDAVGLNTMLMVHDAPGASVVHEFVTRKSCAAAPRSENWIPSDCDPTLVTVMLCEALVVLTA